VDPHATSIFQDGLFSVPASLGNLKVIRRGFFVARFRSSIPSMPSFDLQGHRGARGLKPENTLPSFEFALDFGVSTIETDVHLTQDGVPVLIHDACLNERVFQLTSTPTATDVHEHAALISKLTFEQLRKNVAIGNPDPHRFRRQDPSITPLAQIYADQTGMHPYAVPTVSDLFAFAKMYASEKGSVAGKTDAQRARALRVCFDLELKRVPFFPVVIRDDFNVKSGGQLERCVLGAIRTAKLVDRTRVRSFDHRCVKILRHLEPGLAASVLIAETAPVSPGELVRRADAQTYCPDYRFLDEIQVQQCHADGIRVVPWTVNELEHWARLIDWGVDGITTDYPDELARYLLERNIEF
jgi:glycerophosphoryl diester phosphodiesterase